MYVLQIDVKEAQSRHFCANWPGYWAGCGYVANPNNAVQFPTRRDAGMAMFGNHLGLNGCMKIVKL